MCIAKVIGKITLTQSQHNELLGLGVRDIAKDNPKNRTDINEIIDRIGDAEAIIINISTHITKDVIRQCKNLRFIQTWSTGTDNIDMAAAQQAGIFVKNVPDFSIESVAEKTLAMMIFIANQMREANKDVISGNWNYTKFQGIELKGKTLGIIGSGRIGNRVAELASAFGMSTIIANSKTSKQGIQEICSQSNFITLHCPLTQDTYHLLDNEEFFAMTKGTYLINNSRGGVVNEMALLHALNNETICYASVDVFEQEPPSLANPLICHPRVFVTPHTAWNTKESVRRLTDYCIENLRQYLLSKATENGKLKIS